MKKIVLVNVDFIDVYTGKLHKAGDKVEMTDERIAEVRGVNPEFVSVIGTVAEPAQAAEKADSKAAEKQTETKAAKAADKKSK